MLLENTSAQLFERAVGVIPGGVNSPVRAWRAVGGDPLFVRRGRGSRIWDADGHEYIDYVGSWGPLILGHAHPEVLAAIEAALHDGTTFGAPTAREVELAERLAAATPSMRMVRLVSSGTEAAMSALRVARGATGRAKVVKFSGCYHGHSDGLLVRAGSGAATFGVPDSAGVPEAMAAQTLVAEFNDLDSVARLMDAHAGEIAAVIVEPVVGNMGVILPAEGFLHGLRELTRRAGALLIFDEVITGFRLRYGGVQQSFAVEPDLTVLGKIVGGGLPLAAFGGSREVMQLLAPVGPVYQAGTLSGNPLATAAGLRTLELLATPGTYERLDELGERLERGLKGVMAGSSRPACVNRRGSMWTVFFGVDRVPDVAAARRCDTDMFARWFRGMLERGIYLPPSQFEAAFVSLAHSEADIDATIRAAGEVWAAIG